MLERQFITNIQNIQVRKCLYRKRKFTNSVTKKKPRGDVIRSSSCDGLDSVSQLVEAVKILSLQEVLEVLEEELVFHQELDVRTVETTEIEILVSQEAQTVLSPYLSVSSMASSSSSFSPQD